MGKRKNPAEAWNAKCEKAERALDKAVKRWSEAPDDATQDQLNALSKAMSAAQVALQELYENLPYSVDDVTAEYEAQQRVAEMVASGQVKPRKMKQITSGQVAEVVHRYLSNRHALDVMHDETLNRHEWTIDATMGYDIPHEDIPAHNVILGRIWVEPNTKEGEVTGWTIGYGLPKGELRSGDSFRLATEFRGAYRAVDKEFQLSQKWEEFVPELPKPDEKFSAYGREGGRPAFASYDRAYRRITSEGMGKEEAFRHYLEEKGKTNVSVKLRGEQWRLFKKAMGRRKVKMTRQ